MIVGGGLAGLSVALYLTQLDPSRHITILEMEDYLATDNKDVCRVVCSYWHVGSPIGTIA